MPFPHVERALVVRRPALVVARLDPGSVDPLLWVFMVTNQARAPWNGDIAIPDSTARGLIVASKVRTAKITTVEASSAVGIGRLDDATWQTVLSCLADRLPRN